MKRTYGAVTARGGTAYTCGMHRDFDPLPCCGLETAHTWGRHARDSKPPPARREETSHPPCPAVEPSPARGEETAGQTAGQTVPGARGGNGSVPSDDPMYQSRPGGEKTRLCRASPPLFAKSRPCPSLLRQRQDGSACEAGAETRPRRTGSGTGRKRGPPGRCRGKRRDACALRKEAGCVFRRQLLKTKRRMEMLSTMPTRAQFTTRAVPP